MTRRKAKIEIGISAFFGLICLMALFILVTCGPTLLVLTTILESSLLIGWAVTLVRETKEYKEKE